MYDVSVLIQTFRQASIVYTPSLAVKPREGHKLPVARTQVPTASIDSSYCLLAIGLAFLSFDDIGL